MAPTQPTGDNIDLPSAAAQFRPAPGPEVIAAIQQYAFGSADWLYDLNFADQEPWQGDVLPDASVAYVDGAGDIVVIDGPVMLLSTSCDAVPGRNKPVATVAPVFTVSSFLDDLSQGQRTSKGQALRENRYSNIFYLPSVEGMSEQYVNFSYAGPVSTDWLAGHCSKCDPHDRLRLSQNGWYVLMMKLAAHYTRSEQVGDPPRRES
ncbi:hypothetical protein [Roseisolibacter agri]|uniref:Uncharacterized protein n=1 Tax=Roseisolibacter agri TaxID=2014610 RepID=A0AA37V391_9BACT|nr:hypothetical protein [Roseisolibacter agri]GLC26352.1 hypothetical protein rosag_28650 [Roseisolibacter agri]